jgi:hypothetical protein
VAAVSVSASDRCIESPDEFCSQVASMDLNTGLIT